MAQSLTPNKERPGCGARLQARRGLHDLSGRRRPALASRSGGTRVQRPPASGIRSLGNAPAPPSLRPCALLPLGGPSTGKQKASVLSFPAREGADATWAGVAQSLPGAKLLRARGHPPGALEGLPALSSGVRGRGRDAVSAWRGSLPLVGPLPLLRFQYPPGTLSLYEPMNFTNVFSRHCTLIKTPKGIPRSDSDSLNICKLYKKNKPKKKTKNNSWSSPCGSAG